MTTTRLAALREQMTEHNIDVYIILSDDFHGSEYVGDYFKCREFISGFNGSAGSVVVTQNSAVLFTDGRYFLQAEEQLAGTEMILYRQGEKGVPTLSAYVSTKVEEGQTLGFDGRTVSTSFIEQLKTLLQGKTVLLCSEFDLVDRIWTNRPPLSKASVWELDLKYAGISRTDKLLKIREQMAEEQATHHFISSLTDIAWILNLRGGDISYCPIFLAYMVITLDGVTLFVHRECFSRELEEQLATNGVKIVDYEKIYQYANDLETKNQAKVLLDTRRINYEIVKGIRKSAFIIDKPNPSEQLKAIKNETELRNIKKAHQEDGVAVAKFLCWLESKVGKETLTELSVADKLEEFRAMGDLYLGSSFAAIVGYQEHGAIVHYNATAKSNSVLKKNGLLLFDTGGHYLYGSTDITRTVCLGKATSAQKENYTAVLKGHIRLACAEFAYGSPSCELDMVAREPIKELDLNYQHGTGHGIGYLLSVHEGPQNIRMKGADSSEVPFEAGMITSNEPGIYIAKEYGIRLENLMICHEGTRTSTNRQMTFETVTMAPFDRRLINKGDLSEEEQNWLNDYHRDVYLNLAPYLNKEEEQWLLKATAKV